MASLDVETDTQFDLLGRRYKSAYVVAKAIVTIGDIAKVASVILACLIGLVTAVAGGANYNTPLILVGILGALVVGLFGYIGGMFSAATGQMIQAAIDTAVNTSPLISPEQNGVIIGII